MKPNHSKMCASAWEAYTVKGLDTIITLLSVEIILNAVKLHQKVCPKSENYIRLGKDLILFLKL